MAEIRWTREAEQWLRDIYEYIASDNPSAAAHVVDGIYRRAQQLVRFPELGYRYRDAQEHVRILLYGHYRIAYLIKPDGDIEVYFTARSISSDIFFDLKTPSRAQYSPYEKEPEPWMED